MISSKNKFSAIILIAGLFLIQACSYTFTGASVPPHLNTIYIMNAKDKTGSGIAFMSQYFTDKIIDNFVSDNNLQYIQNPKADAKLDCTISSMSDRPVSISNINSANLSGVTDNTREITINIKVVYRDQVKRKTLINKTFSNKASFKTDNYEENREEAIKEVLNKLAEDILLGAVSNW